MYILQYYLKTNANEIVKQFRRAVAELNSFGNEKYISNITSLRYNINWKIYNLKLQ